MTNIEEYVQANEIRYEVAEICKGYGTSNVNGIYQYIRDLGDVTVFMEWRDEIQQVGCEDETPGWDAVIHNNSTDVSSEYWAFSQKDATTAIKTGWESKDAGPKRLLRLRHCLDSIFDSIVTM